MNKDRTGKKKLIAAVLAALAFIILLSGLNGTVLLPLPSLELISPNCVQPVEGGAVISDGNNARLLFLDEDLRVRKAVSLNAKGSPIDVVTDIICADGTVYVTGARLVMGGGYFSGESVVAYSSAGKQLKVVYSEDYGEDEFIKQSCFMDLKPDAEGRLLLAVRRNGTDADILDVSGEAPETVRTVSTDHLLAGAELMDEGETLLLWQNTGCLSVYTQEEGLRKADYAAEVLPMVRDAYRIEDVPFGLLWMHSYFPPLATISSRPIDLEGSEKLLYTNDEVLSCYDYESGTDTVVESLRLTPGLFVRNVLFWLAALYLLVTLAVLAVRAIRKAEKGSAAKIILLVLVAVGISLFYTVQSFKQLEEEYKNRLEAQSGQIGSLILNHHADVLREASAEGVKEYCENKENLAKVTALWTELSSFIDSNGRENSFEAGITVAHDDVLYGLAYTDALNETCCVEYTAEQVREFFPDEDEFLIKTEYFGYSHMMYVNTIRDENGDVLGHASLTFKENHLRATQLNRGVSMFVTLLVILIAVYTCWSTFERFGTTISSWRSRRRTGSSVSRLPLFCGAAAFVCTVVCQFDSVVLVFAAQSLSGGLSPLEAAKYAALPISLYSFGLMAGSTVCGFTVRKLGERSATLLACIVGAVALLAAVVALNTGSLFLFTAAKLIEGLTVAGIVYSTIYAAPFGLPDKEEQRAVYTDCQTASASAGLVGVFAGGYVSEYLSYSAIFAVKAVLTLLLGVICFTMFESRKNTPAAAEEKGGKGAWGFYLKPQVLLLYLGAILPLVIFSCFRSYLFPIYSKNAGISTVMLSNISIISRFLAMAATGVIGTVASKYSPKGILVASCGAMAAALMLFIVSPNVWWAIAVLFITGVLSRSGNLTSSYYTAELADRLGYDMKKVQLCNDSVRGVFNTAGAPILSLFLALGDNMACAAVGSSCMVLTVLFAVFSARRKAAA